MLSTIPRSAIATDNVLIPILPINIHSINIILLGMVSEEVIPVLRPTVPKADITSNRASNNEHFSNISIPIVDKRIITIAVIVKVMALRMRLSGNFLFKIETWPFPLIELNAPAMTAAKVVVFIPPPVLPGEAPINISRVRKRRVD